VLKTIDKSAVSIRSCDQGRPGQTREVQAKRDETTAAAGRNPAPSRKFLRDLFAPPEQGSPELRGCHGRLLEERKSGAACHASWCARRHHGSRWRDSWPRRISGAPAERRRLESAVQDATVSPATAHNRGGCTSGSADHRRNKGSEKAAACGRRDWARPVRRRLTCGNMPAKPVSDCADAGQADAVDRQRAGGWRLRRHGQGAA